MHILYLHQYFVPPDGSGGTRSYEIARRFVRDGHSVTLITTRAYIPGYYFTGEKGKVVEIEGIHIIALDVPYSNKFSYVRRLFSFLQFIILATWKSVQMRDVDVIYATSTPLTIAIPALIAKHWHRRPLVFEIRDLWPELPIAVGALKNTVLIWMARRLERMSYAHSDRIIALSPGMKEGIVRAGYPEKNVTVIPNGCDIDQFQVPEDAGKDFLEEHPYLKGGPLVVYAGTLGLINGVEYLVEIAAEVKKSTPTVRFLIVGDGRQRERITKKAKDLGVLNETLWIIPPISKKKIPALLSASSIATSLFIDLPEMWNNSANKFFDAIAAGRPLMINYQGWHADLLMKYGAGIVVPQHSARRAAEILEAYAMDSEKLSQSRRAASMMASSHFNRESLFSELRKVVDEIYDGSHYGTISS
jgi:glycosyltransferase involved in cell wall biosynthesis